MAGSDQGGERRSENREGRWLVKAADVMDKKGREIKDSVNLYNRNFNKMGSRDKGKRTYVRDSKRRTSHLGGVVGKLDLEKKRHGSCRVESWKSSSDSDTEEGQLRYVGIFKGECSKGRWSKESSSGPKEVGSQSSANGLTTAKNSENESSSSSERPTKIVTHEKDSIKFIERNKDQRGVSFSNNNGRMVSLSLEGPIQLPLRDAEGVQIRGRDFKEVPITVELTGLERVEPMQKVVIKVYMSCPKSRSRALKVAVGASGFGGVVVDGVGLGSDRSGELAIDGVEVGW
ncbi:hypothetical protein EZV62_003232 [Acer yangbiense]|uniref:Uncharacterized protein n=1 Tax=Acer yangbiense TaxID=1000413 RepID=A0A5C7IG51_9ROSI|nr:hypothetical protein EZV62_003232 [Acer yangbiense]